jgi:MFS family permease
VSQLGDAFFSLAILVKVFDMSGSTMTVGKIMMLSILPQILMGFLIGPWIDRFNKVKTLIVIDVARAIVVILIPLANSIEILALLVFVLSGFSTIFNPTITSLIPNVVNGEEELAEANALSSATQSFVSLVGPAIGGFIILYLGINLSFYLDCFSYIFSVLCIYLLKVKVEQYRIGENKGIIDEWLLGLKYISNNKLVRDLIIAFVLFIFTGTAIEILLVSLVKETLMLSTLWLGVVDSAWALGMLIGGSVAFIMKRKISPTKTMFLGLSGAGVMMILLSFVPNILVAILVMTVMGILNTLAAVSSITALQLNIPQEIRGRVFTFRSTLIQCAAVMSMVIGGVLADIIGIRETIRVAGLVELAWIILWLILRIYRSRLSSHIGKKQAKLTEVVNEPLQQEQKLD